jgi:hypothetical protein
VTGERCIKIHTWIRKAFSAVPLRNAGRTSLCVGSDRKQVRSRCKIWLPLGLEQERERAERQAVAVVAVPEVIADYGRTGRSLWRLDGAPSTLPVRMPEVVAERHAAALPVGLAGSYGACVQTYHTSDPRHVS